MTRFMPGPTMRNRMMQRPDPAPRLHWLNAAMGGLPTEAAAELRHGSPLAYWFIAGFRVGAVFALVAIGIYLLIS